MPFLLIIFLSLVCLPRVDDWTKPFWIPSAEFSISATGLAVLFTAGVAFLFSRIVCRRGALDSNNRDRTLRLYDHGRRYQQYLVLIVFAICIWGLGWSWAVGRFYGRFPSDGSLWPGADLLVLAPYFGSLILSWACYYDADRAVHGSLARARASDPFAPPPPRFGSRLGYIGYQLRQKVALILLPLVLHIVQKEFDGGGRDETVSFYLAIIGYCLVASTILGMPLIVRLMLGLRPMKNGPLRDRLLATTRRLGFPWTDLLVWNTRNGMVNAMVIGILPWPRYVIFTDRLLQEFSPDEIEGVLGHELGHLKHRHILTYFAFLFVSVGAVFWLIQLTGRLGHWLLPEWFDALKVWLSHYGPAQYTQALPMMAAFIVYIFVVFGFLSRRCERQADIFGCRTVSCGDPDCQGHDSTQRERPLRDGLCPTGIQIYMNALDKVAALNDLNRDRPGFLQWWQHGSIAQRVSFLERLVYQPQEEPRFQRNVALVKWGLFAVLGALVALMIMTD